MCSSDLVARELGYQLGSRVIVAHGLGDVSFTLHKDQPFRVVGILAPTGTPVDRTVHVPLEAITAIHLDWQGGTRAIGAARSDGDSVVFFRRSDVVSTGDIFTPGGYPVVDIERGGNINGLIASLNRIIEITIPADKQEGGTYVIPGHGRICDEADVVEYRDMATIIRDRVQDMVKKGMTLEQVKAAKPTFDYDPLYGATTGFWTTDKFVDAVYASLAPKKK